MNRPIRRSSAGADSTPPRVRPGGAPRDGGEAPAPERPDREAAASAPDVVHCFVDPRDLQRLLGAMASAELATAVLQSALLAATQRERRFSE